MKRFLKLGIISIILGMLASLLVVAGPASAATFDVTVGSCSSYSGSTGQVVPVTVDMGSIHGLAGFSIRLDVGLNVGLPAVYITNVVINPGYTGVVNIVSPTGMVYLTGSWNYSTSPPRGVTEVAKVYFDTLSVGAAGGDIQLGFARVTDENNTMTNIGGGNLINSVVTGVALPVPTSTISTILSPVAGIKIAVRLPIANAGAPDLGAYSFNARLTALGTSIELLGVQGLNGWSDTLDAGLMTPYLNNCVVHGSRTTASAGGDLALVRIRLVGPENTPVTVNMSWDDMTVRDANGATLVIKPAAAPALSFQRGDAAGNGGVTALTDVTAGAMYLVGVTHPTSAVIVNLASIVHDGPAGDIASPADVLRLMQKLSMLADSNFDLL